MLAREREDLRVTDAPHVGHALVESLLVVEDSDFTEEVSGVQLRYDGAGVAVCVEVGKLTGKSSVN